MADVRHLTIEDTDTIINSFYENLYTKKGHEKPLLDDLTTEEKNAFAKKEAELNQEPESQQLDDVVEKQTSILAANGADGPKSLSSLEGSAIAAT